MKFTQESLDQGYVITAYDPGCIRVREAEYRASLLLMPEKLIGDWRVSRIAQLAAEDLLELATHEPEIILFGTGEAQIFPEPKLFTPLMERGIGYEIMDTAAACRTYNILLSEERRVLAALIP